MIPIQNYNHRQSSSVLFRPYESRKHSPITHVVVSQLPRRSQQFDGRSSSPTKLSQPIQFIPKMIDVKQRISTQGQTIPVSEALKMYSSKQNSEVIQNSTKTSSFTKERIKERSTYTKTTTGESQDDEKPIKTNPLLILKNQLLEKELEIMHLHKEIKQLKDVNNKYQNLEKDYETILKENFHLKQQLHSFQISPGRPSEYTCALSEQDKLKIKTLLGCE